MRFLPFSLVLLYGVHAVAAAPSHADTSRVEAAQADGNARFGLHGYGTVNYFAFDWETDPARRNALDLERLVLYPSVRLSERVRVDGELEIEHGGTGATLEFDRFEEFGEFEQEIEAGGEVVLEQLNVHVAVTERFNVRIGRLKLPIGLASTNDEPNEYFTTTRSAVEASLIPTNWYEIGAQAYGQVGRDRV